MSTILIAYSERVGIVRLNRPKALNALSQSLVGELIEALKNFDKDDKVGAIVLTGSDTVFCAGADIKELKEMSFANAYKMDYLKNLNDGVVSIRKPIISVVNGYALGGGCELAMMCDLIFAGENAVFGQPEIKIGTIPGVGGTQRLLRAIGKAKAMHMILTGQTMSAQEAEAAGLVTKVCPVDSVLDVAIETARIIADFSAPVIAMAKEAVNEAEELGLRDGLRFESRLYHASFSLSDSKEGMRAFVEKRGAAWRNQ